MDPFSMSSSIPGWPQRLLHVPSMTSFQRYTNNIYKSDTNDQEFKEPEYNAISYTWGRWICDQGPSLSVKDISWTVPSVSKDAFSVEDFVEAIHHASRGVSFVWVDIACIDQENREIKMIEIGRQAAIFNGAKECFIWLHSFSGSVLKDLINDFTALIAILEHDDLDASGSGQDDEDLDDLESNESQTMKTYPALEDATWCDSVAETLAVLKSDPWFTSLWTLQEMYLKPTAILMSRDSKSVNRPEPFQGPVSLANLIIEINVAYDAILQHLHEKRVEPVRHKGVLETILQLIRELGFEGSVFNNPCVLYTASKHRMTLFELDRIYGIMQIFGFCLGESANPHRTFTLQQLEVELGAALNQQSPIWAQLFVRSRPALPGKSWLVDQYATVPQQILIAETRPQSMCTISVSSSGIPYFKGEICTCQSMSKFWREASTAIRDKKKTKNSAFAIETILLDAAGQDLNGISSSLRNLTTVKNAKYHELADEMVSMYGDQLHVLLLGKLLEAVDIDEDELVGMVALRTTSERGEIVFQRLGICLWTSVPEDIMEHPKELWRSVTVALG